MKIIAAAIAAAILCTGLAAVAAEGDSRPERYATALAKQAQSCPLREEITASAHAILDRKDPKGLSRIKKRWLGKYDTDAAYLLIRYSGLSAAQTTALFERLEASRVARQAELHTAYSLATGAVSPDTITTPHHFRALWPSGWYTLIFQDDGTRFFDIASREGWSLSTTGYKDTSLAVYLVRIMRGETDATRAIVARAAEEAGQITTALALLSDQTDLAAFHALMARYPDNRFTEGLPNTPDSYGASLRVQDAPIALPIDKSDRPSFRDEYFQIRRAEYRLGRHAFLTRFLNQNGKLELIAAAAAQAFNDRMDDATFDGKSGLVRLYEELVVRIGWRETDEKLQFAMDAPFPSKTMIEAIRRTMAREALTPFMLGDTSEPPARPDLLPPDAEWARWIEIATMLRAGQDSQILETEGKTRTIAIDLAVASGRTPLAQTLANSGFEIADRIRIHRDLLIRMDARCGETMGNPRDGFSGLWTPLYKFPPLDRLE